MLGFKFIIIFNNFGRNENIIFKNSKKVLQPELTNFDFLNLELDVVLEFLIIIK